MTARVGPPLLLLICAVFSVASDARAQIATAVAVVGGSFALGKAGNEFRKSIESARAAASSILVQANDIARARLADIDEIANRTISDMIGKTEGVAEKILHDANKKVNDLEAKIMADVSEVTWKVECGLRRWTIRDLGTALGDLGHLVGTNRIRLAPPVRVRPTPAWYTGCFWWCDPYVVDALDDFGQTYQKIERLMDEAIAPAQISDDTPANNLVGTYEYLSSFAKITSCFYPGSEQRYNRAYIDYQHRARQWNDIVIVIF